ncbi:trigger factor [Polyangium jinanense]|uniref:Trigger factor n=1 Tax=Polyangium jinanense TaxID=2829994 RepID=A0A9X3XBD4_9BACT|nr:trigger factor [Polyangium jinanense]MDC3956579.1 trigger factor [Polyangium jinanense]MDC3985638.1 trigger factor [Polyangium jinanense]
MQVTVEKLSPVLVELKVEIPAEQVRTEVDKAYANLQRSARVRGFRQGKAPRHVLAHLYSGSIHADVARRLVDTTLNRALASQQVQPLSQPDIAPVELRPEESFSYKARFEVRPDIAEVKWEGFEVSRPKTEVTADAIDAEVARLRREHATLSTPEPERPAKAGDLVRIAFTLDVDGKVREDKPQEIETEIGSGQVFKEIEDVLTGMNVGESKDATVAFSERHTNESLRGKTGTFHVTLKEVRERNFPEVDDEFAKDVGHENLEAMRTALSAKIEKELKQKATDSVAEKLVFELCKANPIPVPPSLVEQQAQLTERELVTAARRQGQRLEMTPEIRARVHADAETKVRAGLLMAEIAKSKTVQVTPQDIEKGYEELAEQTGKNVAKVKAEYRDPKKQEMLIGMILEDKILDLIEAAAKITEA